MTEPNTALRAVRAALHMSQDELAHAVRAAGDRAGEQNDCSKRLVQRWEAGKVTMPRGVYIRALEAATGQPIENLGFQAADERYGLDRSAALAMRDDTLPEAVEIPGGPLTGIWLSTYEYVSSGRDDQAFSSSHYVVILHRGQRVQVRSLPETASGRVIMDLTANGQVVTGTWTERTNPNGYYQGSVYSGGIQFLLEPTGHRLAGKWVGFGRDFDMNTGPWTLTLVTTDVGTEAQAEYNRPVEDGG